MRILYSHRIQSRDGQSVHIEELVTAFRKAGHEVLVVGPSLYQKAGFGGESTLVSMVRRHLPSSVAELGEMIYNIPGFLRLRRAYLSFAPDFIYERYNLYYLAGMLLKWRYRVPLYIEVNAPLADERARFGGLGLGWLARRLEARAWRSADRVFVVTNVLEDLVADAGVPHERITVTPNGVDRDAFPPEPYRAREGKPVTVGFVGFVRDWHGLDAAIDGLVAQQMDPPIRVIVVGDGPARPGLEKKANELGVGNLIQFTGLQQRAAIRDLVRGFDIALQPQAVSYASPLKIFEYMACGRAIVAPDQPNIREILRDGETALLFDAAVPGAMWQAVRRLAADPRLRGKLGRAAHDALNRHDYTWQGNAERITAAVAADAVRRTAATVPPRVFDRSMPPGSR